MLYLLELADENLRTQAKKPATGSFWNTLEFHLKFSKRVQSSAFFLFFLPPTCVGTSNAFRQDGTPTFQSTSIVLPT